MNIKYRFMEHGLRQHELAAEINRRMRADGVDLRCGRCCVSLVLSKMASGKTMTPKELKVSTYLMAMERELWDGKAWQKDH